MAHRPFRPCSPALGLALAAGTLLAGFGPVSGVLGQAPPASEPAQPPLPAPSPTPAALPALEPFEGRVIREVRLVGLSAVDEQLVRNQVRSTAGRPLSVETVQQDVARCTRLGYFREIAARAQPFDDATVLLTFEFTETPIIKDVQVVGNRQITDQELRGEVTLLAGTPVDRFQLDRTQRRIEALYRKKGYYQASVTIDQKELDEQGIVLFRIREGDRIKITDIRFDGNAKVESRRLRSQIKSSESGLLTPGTIDDNQLDQDVAAIIKYYKDFGHLDIRADRRIQPAPSGKEAILTFLVEEGPVYTLRSVRVSAASKGDGEPGPGEGGKERPLTIYSPEQLAALLPIKPGDVYSVDKVTKAVDTVRDAYGQMGFVDVRVTPNELRDPSKPTVDLLLTISEGQPSKTGLVIVRGNDLTQDKVVRREVDVTPDRPLDTTAVRDTETRLLVTNLFAGPREARPDPRVTIQQLDPENPGYRDVLVEVEEKNTGSLSFGAAVSSDSGLIGQIVLSQRNFDIADTPDSFGELFSGRAFRGAGQTFQIALQPGTEASNYSVSFGEPSLLGSEYSMGISAYARQRELRQYDDDRIGGNLQFGRRFGTRWTGNVFARFERINIRDIDPIAPTDVFAVQGDSDLSSVGLSLTRNTTNSRIRPTQGTKLELSAERVGALGGDYDFTKLSSEYLIYLTVGEDYLGRKSVLTLRTTVAYIPEGRGDAPIFERYFMGGRTFRGYRFRGVSTRGERNNPAPPPATIPSDDPVGGTWSFFIGPEYEHPLIDKIINGVLFVDSGTITNDPGFDDYRVSAGFGIRLYLPQLGPAPLAFDFGFPIVKQDDDEERVFSFSVDIPF